MNLRRFVREVCLGVLCLGVSACGGDNEPQSLADSRLTDSGVPQDGATSDTATRDVGNEAGSETFGSCGLPEFEDSSEVEPAGRPFAESVHLASNATACSATDFSTEIGCYNASLPPAPSIRRSMVRPLLSNPESATATDSQRSKPFTYRPSVPGQTFIVPEHRTTTDGRIASWAPTGNQPAIAAMSPENATYGLQTTTHPILDRIAYFPYMVQMDPRDGQSRFSAAEVQRGNFEGRGRFWDLCTGTGPEQTDNPRQCRARWNSAADYIDGDCYRITPIFSNVSPENRWELRSIDLIAFVPRGKAIPDARNDEHIWLYPASLWPTSGNTLPDQEPYDYGRQVGYVGPGQWDYDWGWSRFYNQARSQCVGNSQPVWCRFLTEQKHIAVAANYRVWRDANVPFSWSGRGDGHSLLEPATTADGRVMIVHDDTKGILYSYNSVGPCRADGFVDFKPISMAYLDPNVHGHYGFAEYQMRDTRGQLMGAGASVYGGYPWIDRRGSNIMFPHGGGQDGWRVTWEHTSQEATNAEINRANGRTVVVVGAWTRGKMNVLDNGLNATDFTFSQGWIGGPFYDGVFSMQLYRGSTTRVRPAGTALLSSLEASLNHYDAWTPITPADVVWIASSTGERNAEIVFDDYVDPRALVVAHMNSPTQVVRANYDYLTGGTRFGDSVTDVNGFVSRGNDNYNYEFGAGPIELQNASTAAGSTSLFLLGGATVEPVFEGGVRGKGVFLDGENDRIVVPGLSDIPNYSLSVWVDVREAGWATAEGQTLFTFANGARIQVARDAIRVAATNRPTGSVPARVARGRYTHLGFEVQSTFSSSEITVYVDGDPMGRVRVPFALPLADSNMHTVVLGSNGTAPNALRGWFDELRIYRLRTEDLGSTTSRELYCNHALGTLVASTCGHQGMRCEQLDFRHDEAVDAQGVGTGLDYAMQAYAPGGCANSVHRNHGASCARERAFGIESRNLAAELPRPEFSNAQFCTTCHVDANDPIQGLRLAALSLGTGPARLDARRQPLTWPRHIFGMLPSVAGTVTTPFATLLTPPSTFLDVAIMGPDATTGPRRITPR